MIDLSIIYLYNLLTHVDTKLRLLDNFSKKLKEFEKPKKIYQICNIVFFNQLKC